LFLPFEKIWPYHKREMETIKKRIDFEIWIEIWPYRHREMKKLKYVTKIRNEKIWKFTFLKFEMKISVWNLKKNWPYHQWEMKKIWNEKIIYFVYAIEIKFPITPLYHLCVPPYTTGASCGDIQLISAIGSFHTDPFPTMV
jgi:hypothetical protein